MAISSGKLWHYTTGHHWEQIQKDGFIKTTPKQPGPGEIAAVWYSSNQLWEPTAAKQVRLRDTGERVGLTSMEFLHSAMSGLVRIAWGGGDGLWSWEEFCERAPWQQAFKLGWNAFEICRELGWAGMSGPFQWYMTPHPVPKALWGEVQLWDGKEWG